MNSIEMMAILTRFGCCFPNVRWNANLSRMLYKQAHIRLLASFDMGAKNLACCVINIDTEQIEEWFLINIFRATSQALGIEVKSTDYTIDQHIEVLVPSLEEYTHIFNHVTHVAIELQPAGRGQFANNKMSSLQHALKTWFLTKYGICAKIMSATLKMKVIKQKMKEVDAQTIPPPTTPKNAAKRYQYNKKRAKQCVAYIGHQHASASQMTLFNASKKKDDYEDEMLQNMYRIKQLKIEDTKRRNKILKANKSKRKKRKRNIKVSSK